MQSLKELYKIGRGPSSSHTMAPHFAARRFAAEYPQAEKYLVTLYGSLAKTGKGHMTDKVLKETFLPKPADIIFDVKTEGFRHANTMRLQALRVGKTIGEWLVYSTGGGSYEIEGRPADKPAEVYKLNTFDEIKRYCREHKMRICDYVRETEGDGVFDYLRQIYAQMKLSVENGLSKGGELDGGLGIQRKAGFLFAQRHMDESAQTRENRIVCAYAFAVSEENAAGGTIVTAPTCGSSGIVPAVLLYMQQQKGFSDGQIADALATAGIVGNIIKTNASISGAECGCQAEVGSACSMAAAALAELFDMDIDQIEYAAEVAMEHHLGLTCDPIGGLVQIPCIERNAVAAMRAINALSLANFLTYTRKISFDLVVQAMYETGRDLSHIYKETSEGGLARLYETGV